MSENDMNSTMVEHSTSSLKEALCVQQRLLQKLYNELDVERESAATAASEALSMILRLQGEKAAVKMEAEQYKRLAEEKMNHAEESMEVFEEIMYQKEMVITSLDYQVQAYRYKLLSLGFDDLNVNEIKFPENLLQRNESLVGETSSDALIKRNTLPAKRLKLPNLKKGPIEKDRSITEDADMIARIVEESSRDEENTQNLDLGLKTEGSSVNLNSYLEQIRKLDKLVEDLAGEHYVCPTAKTSRSSSVRSKVNEMDLPQSSQKSAEDKISSDACSLSVHDVFEVPQIDETHDCYEKQMRDEGKSIFKEEEKCRKLATLMQEPVKSYDRDEIYSGKKPLLSKHRDKRLFWPGDGIDVDCHLALIRSTTSATEAVSMPQHTNTTTEITEGEAEVETEAVEQNVRQEPHNTREEQELRLLYEIRDKIYSIQSDIRSRNTKIIKSSPNYDLPMVQLREAMMHFWF